MRKILTHMLVFLTVVTAITLSSCGPKTIGWGVLYIADPDNDLDPAEVLPVYEESEIRDVYTVGVGDSGTTIDIARWKLNFFNNQNEAEAFASEYAVYADIYAVTTKNGLSIRAEADSASDRVYKLREGQTIKIIGRNETKEEIAGHEGYWYRVITEDGSAGWCFDLNLDIYDIKDSGSDKDSIMNDPELISFMERTYRPEYYRDMIRNNMIDLTRFKTSYGIFTYPEEKRITIITEDHNQNFEYTGITRNNSGRFIFEGTSLQVLVRNEDRIAVFFTGKNNREYAETMIYVSNIDELIESEMERKTLLLERIAELGTVSSSAYGSIKFEEGGRFTWNNFKRLVPNVIPESVEGPGKISLDYFPGLSLRKNYDGVISFSFDGVPGLVNFLFELSDLGIKLVYVPVGDIRKNIVEQESSSPLVIFMSGAGE